VKQDSPLNERQLQVLQWIADGCPDGVMTGHSHKISAVALQNRKLVSISKRSGTWHATITDAGRQLIHRDPVDSGAVVGTANSDERDPRRSGSSKKTTSRPAERNVIRSAPSPPKPPSAAEQLIQRVVTAGGSLRLEPRRDGPGWYELSQLVATANRTGKVPPGKRAAVYRAGFDDAEIVLEDDPVRGSEPGPVPVPERVRSYHRAVARYRDELDRQEVSKDCVGRALRILQALAVESERRGYRFEWINGQDPRYGGRSMLTHGQTVIAIRTHEYRLRISEKRGKTEERLNWYATRTEKLPLWQRVHHRVFVATGILRLAVVGRHERQFVDGKRGLEEQLPQLLHWLECKAWEDDQAAARARQEEQRRRREWERAVERAKDRYVVAYRLKVLDEQAAEWRRSEQLREYLAVMRATVDAIENAAERDRAQEWLAWAHQNARHTDPLHRPLNMPDVPEPTTDQLQPFLGRWSAYGPERRFWR
jgi:hypothetical protein